MFPTRRLLSFQGINDADEFKDLEIAWVLGYFIALATLRLFGMFCVFFYRKHLTFLPGTLTTSTQSSPLCWLLET